MPSPRHVKVGLHSCLRPFSPEVKYVLRTLLRLAGVPHQFVWSEAGDDQPLDLYYGPPNSRLAVPLTIDYQGGNFCTPTHNPPRRLYEHDGVALIDFAEPTEGFVRSADNALKFTNDIVFACYWLLTGAQENRYPRDRWDNLDLSGSFLLEHSLLSNPLVSIYGSFLRRFFLECGYAPLELPWTGTQSSAAFIFSHDVDYPEIMRTVECARLLAARGPKGLLSAFDVIRGKNHFWKFGEWVEFEKSLGTRPTFYFMARTGSLLQYAMGTPDGFYDIRSARFRDLFRYLRDESCEIGLHASYHAHRSADQLMREKTALEQAAGVSVHGNRHHYWHLDPAAPHETIHHHEKAGLQYDSSLEFEFYPGFRRGICHPFRVFHPGLRRELNVLELPPTWMDDHFDRRLRKNGIRNPNTHALGLVHAAQSTGGIIVVDYHVRGMNSDFYPRYAPWLMDFVQKRLDSSVAFRTTPEIVQQYAGYESVLNARSADCADVNCAPVVLKAEHTRNAHAGGEPAVSIDFLRPQESAAWDAFVEAHPDGTIYHTIAWKNVTEEGLGHRPYYLRATDDIGEIAGVLPLFFIRGIFGRRLVSVPMRDRGGLLSRDSLVASKLLQRAIALAHQLRCSYLELRSLKPIDSELARTHSLLVEQNWVTTRIDLSPGEECLWSRLDKQAVRWAIRNAERRGVSVEINNSESGIELFNDLFVRTRTAMGIPPFPKGLFRAIWSHLICSGKANLFIVRNGSEPIHAMINLLSKDTFVPAYAAPQNAWRKWYPNECMIWYTIRWAARQGFHFYDFGADSPRQAGLLRFKKKWGGVQHPMHYHFFLNRRQSSPNLDSSAPGYLLMRKAWALLPNPLSSSLGGFLTRQMS